MSVEQKTGREIELCIKNQAALCEERKLPHFAPADGKRWKCNRNIYQNYAEGAFVSMGVDGTKFVTGCPHCNRTYCD